jgi:hypothetical protein
VVAADATIARGSDLVNMCRILEVEQRSTARLKHRAEDLALDMPELQDELKAVWDQFLGKLPTSMRDKFKDNYDRAESELRFLNP